MFSAEFLDGPMQDARHEFLGADEPFVDLYATPNPTDSEAPWLIVGYTGLEPEHPWPKQVHYERVSVLGDGGIDGCPLAHYALPIIR